MGRAETRKYSIVLGYSRCASFCNFNVVALISFAIPPAIRPNSLGFCPSLPLPLSLAPIGVAVPLAGSSRSFDSSYPLPLVGNAVRERIEERVEWNSAVRSRGVIARDTASLVAATTDKPVGRGLWLKVDPLAE